MSETFRDQTAAPFRASRRGRVTWRFLPALTATLLGTLTACTSRTVQLVNPQSGASYECSGSGFGLASAWLKQHIDDCIRRSESRGYVPVETLSPGERADLQSRGILPKSP